MQETATDPQVGEFDPLDPEFIEDPHRFFREMRDKCPVAHSDTWGGFWALLGRSEVVEAAKRNDVFINSVLHIISGRKGAPAHTRPLMHSDQPEHTWFRAAMVPVFNGPLGAQISGPVRAEAERLVAAMAAHGSADLVRDYCGPLMAFVITQVFGLDDVDAADLDRWARNYVHGGQMGNEEGAALLRDAHENMVRVASELIADRRENPRDPAVDLATALIQAEQPDGRPLDPDKVVGAVRQPFLIIWLATSHSLANMLQRLLEDRALQEVLRRDPQLIAQSVEEFLRMDMPQIGFARTSTHELEFAGIHLREGDPVALVFPAANRDPRVFENPDEFVIGRSPNPHLTFGAGIHSCPGKNIARDVIRSSLESIIQGTGSLELAGRVEKEFWPFRAPLTLPARLTPAP